MTWYPGKREAENEREKYRDKIRFRLIIEHENYTHEEDVYLKSKYHVKDFIAVILMNGYVMDCSAGSSTSYVGIPAHEIKEVRLTREGII